MPVLSNSESHMQNLHNISGGKHVRGSSAYSIFNPATLQYAGERDYDMSGAAPLVTGTTISAAIPAS